MLYLLRPSHASLGIGGVHEHTPIMASLTGIILPWKGGATTNGVEGALGLQRLSSSFLTPDKGIAILFKPEYRSIASFWDAQSIEYRVSLAGVSIAKYR